MKRECVRVANALLVLPDHRWVMQRRDDKPNIADPGMLSFFGGHIEDGEAPGDAIVRELAEETSLACGEFTLARVYTDTEHYPKDVEVHVFHRQITDMDFEVYEGVGSEAYLPNELVSRNDISGIVESTLEQFGVQYGTKHY